MFEPKDERPFEEALSALSSATIAEAGYHFKVVNSASEKE